MKKLSMEIMYVPQATVAQKKEMVLEWRTESENVFRFSMISACVSVFATLLFYIGKVEFFYIYIGSAAIALLSGYMAKKWSLVGYLGAFASVFANCIWFSVGLPEGTLYRASVVAVVIISLIPCIPSARCIFNYSNVFLPLKNSKGFPDFIVNTADLYGDKLYLKDKPSESANGSKFAASYNPFSSEKDIKDEEFRRNQELKSGSLNEPVTMNIDATGEIVKERKEKKYKYGKSIGGAEIIFAHDDIPDMPPDEKAMLMGKWRKNVEWTEKRFYPFLILMMLACMSSGFGSLRGFLNYIVIVGFVSGIVNMKNGRTLGVFMVFAAAVYSVFMCNDALSLIFVIAAFIVNIGILIAPVRFLLNKKLYNELSQENGFPTFSMTTADLYGSQMYIVEDRPIIEKKKNKDHFITMNIGYDEPKASPKEDKAWNAFDYMDEENKETEKNDQSN